MRIELNTTRGEIKRYNMSFSDPLDVLKIINIIQNGNWLIVLGFNDKNNNVLIVKSESDLNKDILLKVLDGRIPSIYSFPELHIKIDSKCFSSETLTDTIHNKDIYYEFNEDGCVFNGNIKIVGFPSIAMLQKRIDLTKWVYDNTWIGSLKYFNKKYRCDFEIFGNRYSVETRKKSDLIKDYPVFHNEYTLMQDGILVGDLYLLINPNTDKHCFRHSKYGLLNIETIEKYFWKKFNKFKIGGIEIEIDIKNYEMFTNIGTYDKNNMLRICNNLFEMAENINRSSEFIKYKNEIEDNKKRYTAREITKRQERAEGNKKIYIDGKLFFTQPTGENELVSLYMKLEAANKLPFECNVFEYTKKLGIDALANFRFSPKEAYTRYAPVEFEFMLENYFDHEHPIEQTSLIICWDYSEEFKDITGYDYKIYEPWLIYIYTDVKILPAVIIKRYKKIKIS